MIKFADISPCKKYRYKLGRIWDRKKYYCAFIMLNPSTADGKDDDATLRRCIGFAKSWGYGGVFLYNLFAIRATNPRIMMLSPAPIGPENDQYLLSVLDNPCIGAIITAWGNHGRHMGRDRQLFDLVGPEYLKCLGATKEGSPRHPLYLKADTKPVEVAKCTSMIL